ncbi:MAG: DNA mismatch repair endonuclease MutL [Bacteroidales bacterium]|nr:DNA mismatch repair endonuclease MutL [Bacteroidales bacterium]
MSDIIKMLPDAVANQIAAGEVIQRPASVVKELLENSVDSGATEIQLIVKDAGRTLIQVIDNGKGMSFNDARLCFERHATSKLRAADDLYHIRTKGFRGEALASIAAIAYVELKTKQAEETIGTAVTIEGAEVKCHEHCATQDGTSIAVKNLFFNVPARRNFLKSDNVEMTHIEEEFYRVALIHHDLGFTLYHNGKMVYHLEPTNMKQRIVNIFGNSFKDKLYPVDQETDILNVHGFIAKPENAKKKKAEQYMFINDRYVRHPLLNYAVEQAYAQLIPQGYRPAYFIAIDVDPANVDINVSPTKVEVKLQDDKLLFGFVLAAVKKSLGTMALSPQIDFDLDPIFELPKRPADRPIVMPKVDHNPNYNPFDSVPQYRGSSSGSSKPYQWNERVDTQSWNDFLQGLKTENIERQEPEQLAANLIPQESCEPQEMPEDFPYFVVRDRYLFLQLGDRPMVVNVVNARERILYERNMKALEDTPISVQQSLFPTTITLTPSQADLADSLKSEFQQMGYELEKIDMTHFAVNGTPNNESEEGDIQDIISTILDEFKSNTFLHKTDKYQNIALCMARQYKGRQVPLHTVEAVREFLRQLFSCDCPTVTPSQKKIIHYFDADSLESLFG